VYALALLALAAGCAPGLRSHAERQAARELSCSGAALRVRPIGQLVLGRGALNVLLYDAAGCEREQLYLCVEEPAARCVTRSAQLATGPAQDAALTRALHLLRTTARARCPEATLRVVQESESLFRFEACDGAWLYHCRARGCERL
jgi:hypothetical protein